MQVSMMLKNMWGQLRLVLSLLLVKMEGLLRQLMLRHQGIA
jgi:hypothetical protein